MTAMKAIRTERGLDRLVNFSDATVAIAITLLILPLVDVATEMKDHSAGEVLTDNWGQLLGFVISFWVIGRFWIIHHQVFEWVADYSHALIWANLLWMSSIVFIPFVANALANIDTTDRPDLYALYIGTMIVASLSMALVEVILARHPDLLREDARDRIDFVRVFVPSGILAVALILAILVPSIGMLWLLLLFLGRPLTMVLRRIFPARGSQTAP
jgi:uncharacterized membrane protein